MWDVISSQTEKQTGSTQSSPALSQPLCPETHCWHQSTEKQHQRLTHPLQLILIPDFGFFRSVSCLLFRVKQWNIFSVVITVLRGKVNTHEAKRNSVLHAHSMQGSKVVNTEDNGKTRSQPPGTHSPGLCYHITLALLSLCENTFSLVTFCLRAPALVQPPPPHSPFHPPIQGRKHSALFAALSQGLGRCLDHSKPSVRKHHLR